MNCHTRDASCVDDRPPPPAKAPQHAHPGPILHPPYSHPASFPYPSKTRRDPGKRDDPGKKTRTATKRTIRADSAKFERRSGNPRARTEREGVVSGYAIPSSAAARPAHSLRCTAYRRRWEGGGGTLSDTVRPPPGIETPRGPWPNRHEQDRPPPGWHGARVGSLGDAVP